MPRLTDSQSYADAQAYFSAEKLWELFDGDRERLNIAHECVDRHADSGRDALIVAHADGADEVITYRELAEDSSRFAHYLERRGIQRGQRVAIMLDPSRAFYTAMFGVIKRGAIAVPLFTLFGPDGIRLRVHDCQPALIVTNAQKMPVAVSATQVPALVYDDAFHASLQGLPPRYAVQTRADDLAVFQYTSGTTRELPDAVKHTHRALVTLTVAALYGTGLRPGDRFFCPSSPAWGHGLWHGTLAPLGMGLTVGAYSGRFHPERLLQALSRHRFTNMSAAATHYRMMKNCGKAGDYAYCFGKLSFTGEPIDDDTADFVRRTFGLEVCSMYGTTEIGVVLASYPGAPDFPVKRGSLGKPVPGTRIEVHDAEGRPCPPGATGQLMVLRKGEWIPTKDLGRVDEDGYYYHAGRADDVIISAGWTMSAVEIENAILLHPDVLEAAAIGVPDEVRGQVVKAFVVTGRAPGEPFVQEIQELVRSKLSQHEYPRHVAFVPELPKTPAGKVHRKVLREREAAAAH
ncbi:acyl-CoA synthetase [Alicycliphilus denitrificans]|uniref:Acyl-CoA synthetase n=1 Tax=Alicycliphilus denitrificans TaxID=179636 RepID=A0A858ZZN2_9BURK|nr:acyl-CoA synthetase [Alicycliphilus denitrificans]ADV02023.1 AMP-dependent synthetase and ligase [Alicycliphilus denitrificans BC]QKD46123.1 acyl-CoA synthetase [Alicycliphilus denitrificans]GAO25620.1 AMP-dependent synthetase [Alicycliphilus sp. B1]